MKVVASTLSVARSNLVEQLEGTVKRRGRYQCQGDEELLAAIRQLTDARPTYGKQRITALLNRARRTSFAKPVNHERVFRSMVKANCCYGRMSACGRFARILAKSLPRRLTSDGYRTGWRSVAGMARSGASRSPSISAIGKLSHGKSKHRHISGGMMRDLMLACVKERLNAPRAPHSVQWLTDNGSAYTTHETVAFAAALGLVPCFTPMRSPESNGVSQDFVKTLKRDYARIQPRPDALTVMQQLSARIEDYNEDHPHSGLRMRSPREFIQARSQPASCPVNGTTPTG